MENKKNQNPNKYVNIEAPVRYLPFFNKKSAKEPLISNPLK